MKLLKHFARNYTNKTFAPQGTLVKRSSLKLGWSVGGLALLITLGGCGADEGSTPTAQRVEPTPLRSVQLVPSTDRAELEAVLKTGMQGASGMLDTDDTRFSEDVNTAVMMDSAEPIDSAASGEAESFTATNVQEAGVDEADLVKYDGDLLYVGVQAGHNYFFEPIPEVIQVEPFARSSVSHDYRSEPLAAEIWITRTLENPVRTETVTTLAMPEGFQLEGLYLFSNNGTEAANRLVVTGHTREVCDHWDTPWCWQLGNTSVRLYDVSSPETPVLISQFETNAHRVASRRVGNHLYLATRFTPSLPGFQNWVGSETQRLKNQAALDNASLEDLLPVATHDEESQPLMPAENCFISPSVADDSADNMIHAPAIFGITQLDLSNLEQVASVCAVGEANGIYASAERLFVFADHGNETHVHGFGLNESGPMYVGSGVVEGNVGWRNNTFRFSAVEDQLRVISSQGTKHRLTILELDADAQQYETVSVLPNSARPDPIGKPNESIYGVRFFNDRAYVVTFLRTDPLYVINLSNPLDPFVEGELELPGFSDYLHPVSTNLLLGVGQSATDTGVQQGVKLALFDVSNPASPRTLKEVEIGGQYSYTPVSYDHKAFSWLPNYETGQHRFALPVKTYGEVADAIIGRSYASYYSVLSLWSLQGEGDSASLSSAGEIAAKESGYSLMRGIINQDAVHYVVDRTIHSAYWYSPSAVSVNDHSEAQ